jgi:hypothetical protein
MQCPDCGYEADDEVVFCPHCRFQFRESSETTVVPDTTHPDTPMYYGENYGNRFEETQRMFPDKEIRLLEVQLMQPALLVVLIISLFTYSLFSTIPFIPLTVAGLSFAMNGILSLTCGLFAGAIFFYLARWRAVKKPLS